MVVIKATTEYMCTPNAFSMSEGHVMQPKLRNERVASEFPATPSTFQESLSRCASEYKYMEKDLSQRSSEENIGSYIICTPTLDMSICQESQGLPISSSDMSFEIQGMQQVKNVKDAVPDWDDDDVDELMVLSPKRKSRTLSAIPECVLEHKIKSVDASDFEVIRPLASHGHQLSQLVLSRHIETSRLYAIRVLRKYLVSPDSAAIGYMRTEQAALKLLTERSVPFTTRLYWSFQDERALYLITTECPYGNLRTFVEHYGPLRPDIVKAVAAELAYGLLAIHAAGIVHCDLKSESVVITHDGHIAISDFCRAMVDSCPDLGDSLCVQDVIHDYQAPELILAWTHNPSVDWWSFALVLCFILTGKHALLDECDKAHPSIVRSKILHGELLSGLSALMSPPAFDLISRCLQRNAALRLTGLDVKIHQYFSNVDWESIVQRRYPVLPNLVGDNHSITSSLEDISEIQQTIQTLGSSTAPLVSEQVAVVEGFTFTWEDSDTDHQGAQVLSSTTEVYGEIAYRGVDSQRGTDGICGQDCSSSLKSEEQDDGIIPAELGGCHPDLPSPRKIGTLRKYSSLNFDLDTLGSMPTPSGRMNPLGASPASPLQPLRKSHSIYASPFTTTTATSTGTRNKLRKKTRPDSTPILAIQHPALDLPPGIEQIGNGIGYTRRPNPVRPSLSISTLTPRSCHAMFAGRRFAIVSPRKKAGGAGSDGGASGEGFDNLAGGVAVIERESEDEMDAIMQEMYGSRWNLGASASEMSHAGGPDPRVYTALSRTSVGLGLGESALDMTREGRLPVPPTELATLSPDSTLRLVPPSPGEMSYC